MHSSTSKNISLIPPSSNSFKAFLYVFFVFASALFSTTTFLSYDNSYNNLDGNNIGYETSIFISVANGKSVAPDAYDIYQASPSDSQRDLPGKDPVSSFYSSLEYQIDDIELKHSTELLSAISSCPGILVTSSGALLSRNQPVLYNKILSHLQTVVMLH